MNNLDSTLVKDSLNFHGPQLQKFFEIERVQLDPSLVRQCDFRLFNRRRKYLAHNDRAKRFKVQQFIAKKANFLFKPFDSNNQRYLFPYLTRE